MINHKRDFTVETVTGSNKADFHFPDVDSAKNAWMFCVLQHTFFREYELDNTSDHTDKNPPVFQQSNLEVDLNFVSA